MQHVIKKWLELPLSRRFWAVISSALLALLQDRIGLSPENAQLIVSVIMSWIVSDSLAKTGGQLIGFANKVLALPRSRRFQTAVGGVLLVLFQDAIGLSIEQSTAVIGLLDAWIIGKGFDKTGTR